MADSPASLLGPGCSLAFIPGPLCTSGFPSQRKTKSSHRLKTRPSYTSPRTLPSFFKNDFSSSWFSVLGRDGGTHWSGVSTRDPPGLEMRTQVRVVPRTDENRPGGSGGAPSRIDPQSEGRSSDWLIAPVRLNQLGVLSRANISAGC